VRDRQRAREIAEEDGARLQRRDQQRLPTGVRTGERLPELGDAAADLLAREVDLPDRVAVLREPRS